MNGYQYRYPYPNELFHHGVGGQKWGVRHGPPYPLYEGDGNSKAVRESKAKYGPSDSGFAARRKEKGHHTKFERQMARKEEKALKKANKLAEKSENVKSASRKERLENRSNKAKAVADNIANKGMKYYELDKKEQRKISNGYARAKFYSTMRLLTSDAEDYNVINKGYADRGAEAKAMRKIDEEYNRKHS